MYFKTQYLMTIKLYKSYFINELSFLNDEGEAESFFYLILENKHNLKRVDLVLQPELSFSESEIENWNLILKQLQQEIPIQYILGTTSFFGLDFNVNKNVLIPRPETEELVQWILNDIKILKLKNLKIIDIGTGSGAIAIALAKNIQEANVHALDVSENALAVAKKNAIINNVDIAFFQKNILETDDLFEKYDVIVSNPPYVRNLEKAEIKNNVLQHEPHLALFVDDNDALIFYKKIAHLAMKNLSHNGKLYFEINQYLGKESTEMLKNMSFTNIELRKDIYGNDRIIRCSLV